MENERTDLSELPELKTIFDEFRKGRHICGEGEDRKLYVLLQSRMENFKKLFGALGFQLEHHHKGFFYFQGDKTSFNFSTKISLFFFIIIDHFSSKVDSLEAFLFCGKYLKVSDMPHMTNERYRKYMDEAKATVEKCLSMMQRLGFVDYQDTGKFRLKPPAYRFYDLIHEINNDDAFFDKQHESLKDEDEIDRELLGAYEQPEDLDND